LFYGEKADIFSVGARDELFFKLPLTWTEEAYVYKFIMVLIVLLEGLIGTPARACAIVGILSIDMAISDVIGSPSNLVTD